MPRYIDADKEDFNPKTINGVSLDEAIKIIENTELDIPLEYWIAVTTVRDYAEWYRSEIENAPTADVKEVVYGEWIGDGLECSVCGELLSNICDGDSYLSYEYSNGADFCPHCSANMKKESNNE